MSLPGQPGLRRALRASTSFVLAGAARIAPAGAELASLIERREPVAEADPYASVTPFEQLLHDH
ncbi:MAG: hypothetical protein ACRDPD_30205 [Streptosporangiaceae bacterium]